MFDLNAQLDRVCKLAINRARNGVWNGKDVTPYFESCKNWCLSSPEVGCIVIFTRDVGYHSSGWWKNPDYERCYHLSVSHATLAGERLPRNVVVNRGLVDRLFDKNQHLLWAEPPYSESGKKNDVWHYRLFCDEAWQPILPRGEVYNKELTESGWLSWSDARAADAALLKSGNTQ